MPGTDPIFQGPWLCPKCRSRFEADPGRCPHDGRSVVADLTGRVIGGRYTLKELLGIGGMDSSVWLAVQVNIDRHVAIKLLPRTTSEAAERFARGARIASKLNHPNITVVHDYGRTDDGHLFLVMELLEGHTLQMVVKQGPVATDRAIHIVDQVLKALDHAHKRQVVHRDIKPANLFLTPRNDDADFTKVLDFGIARFIDDGQGIEGDPHDEITTARQICGTPQYMAPEQVASGPVDQRTDLYALGVVFYRLLTGRLPWTEREHTALFMHHLHSTPPPFGEVQPNLNCPPELEALVMRALAKHPDERYASAAEMRRALRQVRHRLGLLPADREDSVSASRSGAAAAALSLTTTETPHDRKWLPLILLLLLAAVVSIVMLLTREPPTTRAPGLFPDAGAVVHVVSTAPPASDQWLAIEPADAGAADSATPSAPEAPDVSAEGAPAVDAGVAERVVMLRSRPPSVDVRIGGRSLGSTPLTLELAPGTHRLVFSRSGYESYGLTLDLAEGEETLRRTITLKRRRIRRPAPATGVASAAPASQAPESNAPESNAPESNAPPSAAPPSAPATKAAKKVHMRLLDEDDARSFGVGGQPRRRPGSGAKPAIKILE